jgi:hypothetical protein
MFSGRVSGRFDPRRLGRRGAFLLLFGAAWAAVGYSMLKLGEVVASPALDTLLYFAPFRTWAGLWVACGVVAVSAAFSRRPGLDGYGFVALIIPPGMWGMSYGVSYIEGYQRGLSGCVVYFAVALAVFIVAGWPEVQDGD